MKGWREFDCTDPDCPLREYHHRHRVPLDEYIPLEERARIVEASRIARASASKASPIVIKFPGFKGEPSVLPDGPKKRK